MKIIVLVSASFTMSYCLKSIYLSNKLKEKKFDKIVQKVIIEGFLN